MKFFNNSFLQKILNTHGQYKIFVNKEYLSVSDAEDIADPIEGIGFNQQGKPVKFQYAAIKEVLIGDQIFTVDQLNPEEPKEEKPEKEDSKEEPDSKAEKPPKEEKPKDEPEKKENVQPGDRVMIMTESLGILKGIVSDVDVDCVYIEHYNRNTGRLSLIEVKKSEIVSCRRKY